MINQHVSNTSEEIEEDDNLVINPARESSIVQRSEPIFNSSNYEELAHEYLSDTSEKQKKECGSNQETLSQPKVAVYFSPFAICHTLSASCSSSDCTYKTRINCLTQKFIRIKEQSRLLYKQKKDRRLSKILFQLMKKNPPTLH